MPITESLLLLATRGWTVLDDRVPAELLDPLRHDLEQAATECRRMMARQGMATGTDGAAFHVFRPQTSFEQFLATLPGLHVIEQCFGSRCVLNTFGGFINLPSGSAYVNRVHRDIRTFLPGEPLMLNMLVLLDDFTPENGATRLLAGSHHVAEQPDDDVFNRHAGQLLAPAGSVALFDSRVWHAAGDNQSDHPRRALTLNFTRPFMKPQFDYPRFLGEEYGRQTTPVLRQLLGYHARVPASHEEWFQPPERRCYRPDQEAPLAPPAAARQQLPPRPIALSSTGEPA